MRHRSWAAISVSVLLLAACTPKTEEPAVSVSATPNPAPPAETAPPAPQLTQEEAMAKMIAAGTPGEPHKKLEGMIGTWNARVVMYHTPDAPPQESTGTSENKWILGGRYVEQRFKGSFEGQDFEGIGYTGYDNVKGEYFGTWMDSMSTGMMVSKGTADPAGTTMTFTASMKDPVTEREGTYRQVVTVQSSDAHMFEMYGPGPDGKEYRMMEITYTRKGRK